MDSVVNTLGGRGLRGSQDETSPFPLEFMVERLLSSSSQDETSPFPLDFVVVARKRRANQDETAPFPLEYQVTLPESPESEPSAATLGRLEGPTHPTRIERTRARPRRARHQPPRVEASAELRTYAARIAAGEALPPFRGPVVANEVRPRTLTAEPDDARPVPSPALPVAPLARPVAHATPPASAMTIAKLALCLALMTAALVAAAVGGDDASLRALGSSIGGWFTGNGASFERPPLESASSPCHDRVDLAPAAARR